MRYLLAPLTVCAAVIVGSTACTTAESRNYDACLSSGSIVLFADPSDDQTDMIGCVTPAEYTELFDNYTKIEEVSDD